MGQPAARDFFERAREVVSAGLFVAGAAAVVGSLLDWVSFSLVEPAGSAIRPGQHASPPVSGFDVGDGKWVLGAGIVIIVAAFLLVLRRAAVYAGLALVASIVIGSIAISDYRGVANLTSDIARKLNLVGEPHPALGLTLVAMAALLGLVVSVAGIAATPRGGG